MADHVEGLPIQGYVPGERYEIRVRWPEFTARAEALRAEHALSSVPPAPGAGDSETAGPDLSVLAELTTPSGRAAGSIEMDYSDIDSPARREEWCEHLDGVPASQLFDSLSPTPDTPVLRCDPLEPTQRCIATIQVCGARTLRFSWIAPPAETGQVWFAAGMVATEHLSAESTDDDVTEILRPIFPVGSAAAGYVEKVEHGCALVGLGSGVAPQARLVGVLFVISLLARARRRRQEREDESR